MLTVKVKAEKMPEFNHLCRICLKETQDIETMQPLFDETNERCNEIVQQIEECGGIVLKPHDDFPRMICQSCLDILDTSYKFRAMCQASEHALLDVIIKSELHLESVDEASQTPTHAADYIELRGEFIDAEEIDEIVEGEQLGVDDVEYCERYSPMATDNEEFPEELPEQLQMNEVEEGEVGEEDEFHGADNYDDPEFEMEPVKLKKIVMQRRQMGQIKKSSTTKAAVVSGNAGKRKRGRPKLSNLSYPVVKRKEQPVLVEEAEITRRILKPSFKGRRKIEDIPTSIMCEICGNIYSKPALLHVHMRRHLEEKPYECEICNKRFSGNSEVRRHMRVHTGEKPYVCRFCGRTFADRSTNIKHERIHTNERPFTCTQCGKSFTYSNVLKNHMLIHTGEKPFPCEPCNKTFSRKHQLEQHCLTLTHQNTIKINLYREDIGIDSADEHHLQVC